MNPSHVSTLDRRMFLKGSAASIPFFISALTRGAAQERPAIPGSATPDLTAEQITGNTAFAFDLYAALRQQIDTNMLFSPYSTSVALAMTYAGAAGKTATEMEETLHLLLPQPELHEAFAALNADLLQRGNAEKNQTTVERARGLHLANGVWAQQGYPFRETYMALLEEYYGAGLQEVDFLKHPEEARLEINAWVANQTEERILDIVPKGVIDTMTRLVLANAIWFYGGWADSFDAESTREDRFTLLDGSAVSTPFMTQRSHLPYTRGDGFQIIEFPYEGSGFAFTVILPDSGTFDALEASLDSRLLDSAVKQLVSTDVRVFLPKLKFEFEAMDADGEPLFTSTLQEMGMTDAFDTERADFANMWDESLAERLYIKEVLHKAFISVDEHGTEAAAATVVIINATPIASPPGEDEPLEVRIDRPFIFAIRDTQTGTLLFLGRVLDPSV